MANWATIVAAFNCKTFRKRKKKQQASQPFSSGWAPRAARAGRAERQFINAPHMNERRQTCSNQIQLRLGSKKKLLCQLCSSRSRSTDHNEYSFCTHCRVVYSCASYLSVCPSVRLTDRLSARFNYLMLHPFVWPAAASRQPPICIKT